MTRDDFYVGQEVYIISDQSTQVWITTNAVNENGCYVFRELESGLGPNIIHSQFVPFRNLMPAANIPLIAMKRREVEVLGRALQAPASETESWGCCNDECAEKEYVAEKDFDLGSVVILKSDRKKYEDQRSYWTVESRNDRTEDCTLVQINAHGEFKRIVVNEKALQAV